MKNKIPLDRLNPEVSAIRDPRQLHWAQVSLELPLDEVDEADEDTLNRILWHSRPRPRRHVSHLGRHRRTGR